MNMNLYNRELQDGYIKQRIEEYRKAANIFIESARTRQADHLKRAAEMENAFNNIDSIIDQLKQLNKAIAAVLAPVPYEVQDVYRMIR